MPPKAKPTVPRISEAEWDVMRVLWAEHPITANDVVQRLARRREWSPATVKTMLNRLVRKGALRYEPEGKRYLYFPNVDQDACARRAGESFLDRVFGGDAGAMLARFVEASPLTDEEIKALKRILDKKKEG